MGVRHQRQVDARPRVVFRGTTLGPRQIKRIQGVVAAGVGKTRTELAREVCRMFHWRRANGTWPVRGACELLVRLEEAGEFSLPAPRRAQGRPGQEGVREAAALLSATEAPAVARESLGQGSSVSLVVRPIRAEETLCWRAHVERFHYLGDVALVGESLRYVVEVDGKWAALLSWGAASLRNGPRDRYVGWSDTARKAGLHLVVNNARFLILPWNRHPHLASRALAANLRRLSRDWEAAYGHRVVLAETFVDTSRFRGTCYRASNWLEVGETKGWSKHGNTYRFNGQPKAVWLYPLAPNFKEHLCSEAGAPTTTEALMVLDVEKLPLHGEGGLFELLDGITDPRQRRGVRHKIQGVLATAICAVLAGARGFTQIAEWSAEQSRETRQRLGSKYGRPMSERTIRRVLGSVDVAEIDHRTGNWIAAQRELLPGSGLAMDGKTVRGSRDGDKRAIHLLSAVVHGAGTVVAQVSVESKTNEIPKVEPLLDGLDITGVVVTGDALLTQKKIAGYLVEKRNADYVLTAKDNQPTLRQDIATLGLDGFPPSARDVRQGPRAPGEAGDLDQHPAE